MQRQRAGRNNILKKRQFLIPILCAVVLTACGDKTASSLQSTTQQNTSQTQEAKPPIVEAQVQTKAFALTGLPLAEGMKQSPRPIAVMVDNTREAYPQWGIGGAQVVVEAITEGGITRLMCLYNQAQDLEKVGPVRSVRDMFLQLAMPLNAIPVHIGASNFGYNFLNYYNWQTVDGLSLGVTTFDFDKDRAVVRDAAGKKMGREHCWYTQGQAVQNGITAKNIAAEGAMFPLFAFKDGAVPAQNAANEIQVRYSFVAQSGFSYHAESGKYMKTSYDNLPHIDANNQTQLAFDNVVLLRCESFLKPDSVHTDFNLSGGKGWWISAGKMQPVIWKKADPKQPLELFDTEGKPLKVRPGKTYLGFLSGTAGESLTVDGIELLDGSAVNPPVASPTATPAPSATPVPSEQPLIPSIEPDPAVEPVPPVEPPTQA